MAQAPTTARIRQRRRQRLLLIVLLLLLSLGGAAYYLTQQAAPKPRVQERPPGKVAVPVARAPINLGTSVSLANMTLRYYDPLEVPPDALLKPFQFERRVTLRNIPAGSYLRERDLSERDAPSSISGLVRPGMRVVVVETNNIRGSTGFLRAGDHVDVLAIGWSAGKGDPAAAAGTPGVTGPGQPAAGRTPRPIPGVLPGASNATLVAEGAEVLVAPRAERGNVSRYAVLQMMPQDAHLTSLALGGGAILRFVYRPFNEDGRVVEPTPVEQTVHLPRDVRTVEVIAGSTRSMQNASVGSH